jgi:biotin operon repressor
VVDDSLLVVAMQPSIFDVQPRFDGPDLEPSDHLRLSRTLQKLIALMADGKLRTLHEIADAIGCSEAAASARVRDLRKSKFGAFQVDRIRHGNTFWYRVKP